MRRRYRHIHLKALIQGLDTGTISQNKETLCLSADCPAFHVSATESVGVSSDTPLCTPRASEQEAKPDLFTKGIIYGCPAMPPKRSSHVMPGDRSSCEVPDLDAPEPFSCFPSDGRTPCNKRCMSPSSPGEAQHTSKAGEKGTAFLTFGQF